MSLMTLEARGQRLGATQRKSWVSAWCHTVPSPESPDMSVQQSNMTIKVPIGTLYPLERFGCTRIAGLPFTWCPSLSFCFFCFAYVNRTLLLSLEAGISGYESDAASPGHVL